MELGTRFIHTADWQIGLRAGHIPGDRGAAIRNARFDVIQRIADVARDSEADFVVVAGDVFEHHALHRETLQQTFEALRAFRCNVFLLPGNHDPYTPDSLYRSEWWHRECPEHVKVLGSRMPLSTGTVTLLPCPLLERHMQDPTAWLSAQAGATDRVRVGVAHGGVKELLQAKLADEEAEIHNDIPLDLAQRAKLDYLALGDWHGRFEVNERTWYSGTPEATRFKEKQPGDVLVVEVARPGVAPRVTPQRVARYQWVRVERKLFNADDVAALDHALEEIPNRRQTLVEVTLSGSLDLTLHGRVQQDVLARYRDRFHHLRARTEQLQVKLTDKDLDELPREAWLDRVVQRLRDGARLGSAGDSGEEFSADNCQRALHELHRLYVELRANGGAR
jgi:DNA repair exonuclease SbcCD nuclease subunit